MIAPGPVPEESLVKIAGATRAMDAAPVARVVPLTFWTATVVVPAERFLGIRQLICDGETYKSCTNCPLISTRMSANCVGRFPEASNCWAVAVESESWEPKIVARESGATVD